MISGEPSPLRIGFKESVRSAIGIDLPVYLMLSALLIALSEAIGQPLPRTAPVSLMVGVFALIAVEILRRYVLTSRRTGRGQTAVAILRAVVWAMAVGAVPLVVFVAAGVTTFCYGQECDDLSRIFLIIVLVWAVLAALMVIFGYLLLKQASWLQPRR